MVGKERCQWRFGDADNFMSALNLFDFPVSPI